MLIILAIVVINLSLGNNGILNRARTATEQYQNAESQEKIDIAKATNEIDSYVDGNRGTVTLTDEEYAQFKALVAKNNGKYSTDEQIVGTWTDGKPIYQKSFNTNSQTLTNNEWNDVADVSDLKIDNVIFLDALGLYSGSFFGSLIQVNAAQIGVIYPGKNKIQMFKLNNYSSVVNYVTIQYTKTTD